MKRQFFRIVLAVASLLLAANLSFAVDLKKTDARQPVSKSTQETRTDPKAATSDAKGSAKGSLLDINSATESELKSIVGIGDAYAKKIIAGRPYAKKDQLKSRGIMPDSEYAKIKDQIIAKQVSKEAALKTDSKDDPKAAPKEKPVKSR